MDCYAPRLPLPHTRPRRALSREVPRRLARLRDRSELRFDGPAAALAEPARFARVRDKLYRNRWVVYANPPFGGPEQVFRSPRALYPSRRSLQSAPRRPRRAWRHVPHPRYADRDACPRLPWSLLAARPAEGLRQNPTPRTHGREPRQHPARPRATPARGRTSTRERRARASPARHSRAPPRAHRRRSPTVPAVWRNRSRSPSAAPARHHGHPAGHLMSTHRSPRPSLRPRVVHDALHGILLRPTDPIARSSTAAHARSRSAVPWACLASAAAHRRRGHRGPASYASAAAATFPVASRHWPLCKRCVGASYRSFAARKRASASRTAALLLELKPFVEHCACASFVGGHECHRRRGPRPAGSPYTCAARAVLATNAIRRRTVLRRTNETSHGSRFEAHRDALDVTVDEAGRVVVRVNVRVEPAARSIGREHEHIGPRRAK